MSALTADFVRRTCSVSLYRKTARTLISDNTFPPGTTFATPEGLRAEDEETRAAFDVQGGVYPIRESVFRESYVLDAAPEIDPEAIYRAFVDTLRPTGTLGRSGTRRDAIGTTEARAHLRRVIDEYVASLRAAA